MAAGPYGPLSRSDGLGKGPPTAARNGSKYEPKRPR
jgi:hypothetical protein